MTLVVHLFHSLLCLRTMSTSYTPPAGYGDITFTEMIPLAFRMMSLGKFSPIKTRRAVSHPLVDVCLLVPLMSASALRYPFNSTELSFKRALWKTYVSTMCGYSTVRQLQYILPNTGKLYADFQKSHPDKPPVVSENIAHGAALHWLGPKSNKKVMLFVPGRSRLHVGFLPCIILL